MSSVGVEAVVDAMATVSFDSVQESEETLSQDGSEVLSEHLEGSMYSRHWHESELPSLSDGGILCFVNGHVLRSGKLVQESLWVRNGKIMDPRTLFFDERLEADFVVDCTNLILAPGFIDVQINGAFGVDFSAHEGPETEDPEYVSKGVRKVAKGLLAHGVTGFCPTVITSHPEVYHSIIPKFHRTAGSAKDGAACLGLHLEGPFISRAKKGAHPEHLIRSLESGVSSAVACYGTTACDIYTAFTTCMVQCWITNHSSLSQPPHHLTIKTLQVQACSCAPSNSLCVTAINL
eukprot:m.304199 g.304199  ORF g.304199 m.304199 type:complete len:291 (-) comp15896_c0_seq2:5642-6514(-)